MIDDFNEINLETSAREVQEACVEAFSLRVPPATYSSPLFTLSFTTQSMVRQTPCNAIIIRIEKYRH